MRMGDLRRVTLEEPFLDEIAGRLRSAARHQTRYGFTASVQKTPWGTGPYGRRA